jgi:hypothetical protein
VYFLNWNLTLPIYHCCTSFIFANDAIICLANYGRLCTSESKHLYSPLWILILLALIILYFPQNDFIMFLALLKVEPMYFLSKLYVLPIVIACTSQSSTPVLLAITGILPVVSVCTPWTEVLHFLENQYVLHVANGSFLSFKINRDCVLP